MGKDPRYHNVTSNVAPAAKGLRTGDGSFMESHRVLFAFVSDFYNTYLNTNYGSEKGGVTSEQDKGTRREIVEKAVYAFRVVLTIYKEFLKERNIDIQFSDYITVNPEELDNDDIVLKFRNWSNAQNVPIEKYATLYTNLVGELTLDLDMYLNMEEKDVDTAIKISVNGLRPDSKNRSYNFGTLLSRASGGRGRGAHKSTDFGKLKKADIKRMLARQGGIMEDLKALALSKGIKSYTTKDNLIDGIMRKAKLAEVQRFAAKHVKK